VAQYTHSTHRNYLSRGAGAAIFNLNVQDASRLIYFSCSTTVPYGAGGCKLIAYLLTCYIIIIIINTLVCSAK